MTSVGDTLRRARLQRNLELNRIADELKISASMLQAIEEERFDKLPGGVFIRSFVRQYARVLQLDEDEIVGELKRVLQPSSEMPAIPHGAPIPESEIFVPRVSGWQSSGDKSIQWSSSVPALVLMLIVMVACAGAYAWWQRARHAAPARVETRAAAKATQSVTEPVVQAAPAPAAEVSASPNPVVAPVPTDNAASSVAAAATSEAAPIRTEAPAAEPNANAPVRVEVTAVEDAWISARADGQSSFSGVLEANQTRTVTANRNVVLRLGNAGGVAVRWNGKPVGMLGAKGAVRTIQFTSGGFQIVPPEAPKPVPPTESPNPF